MNKDHYWYAIAGLFSRPVILNGWFIARVDPTPRRKISTHARESFADRFRFNFRLLYENHNLVVGVPRLLHFLPRSWKIRSFRIGDDDSINGDANFNLHDGWLISGIGGGLTSSRQRIIGVKRLWTEERCWNFTFFSYCRKEMKVTLKVCNCNCEDIK